MKQLTFLISALFFAITVSAQGNGEVWRYDGSSGSWFQPAPSKPKEVRETKGKKVRESKKKNVSPKVKEKEDVCVECEKEQIQRNIMSSFNRKRLQEITRLYSSYVIHSPKVSLSTDSITIISNYKPWNVYGLIRTNLIGDAMLIPNIGGEITVGKNWSIGTDFYLQWLKDRDRDKFYQTYMLDVDARYWWGRQHRLRPLTGWHAGVYGQAVTFDWENGHKGYQSRVFFWTFGLGGEIGYNKPISKHLGLDIYVGVGYFHTKYNVYNPGHNRKYYFDHRECRNFFGPTRIGISLNYLIK